MAILKNTLNAVQDFDSAMKAAKESYDNAKKEIMATYSETVATGKLIEAQEIMVQIEIEEKEKCRKAIKEDLTEIRAEIMEFVTVPAPADFSATLEAVRAMGQNVTDFEANAYIEKFKSNYTCFRALLDVLHDANKVLDILPCKADAIELEIAELERVLINWVQTYKGNDYFTALLTSEEHTPIKKVGAMVQAFLNGGYVLN